MLMGSLFIQQLLNWMLQGNTVRMDSLGSFAGIATLMEESVYGHAIQSIRFANKKIILRSEEGYFIMVVVEHSVRHSAELPQRVRK